MARSFLGDARCGNLRGQHQLMSIFPFSELALAWSFSASASQVSVERESAHLLCVIARAETYVFGKHSPGPSHVAIFYTKLYNNAQLPYLHENLEAI